MPVRGSGSKRFIVTDTIGLLIVVCVVAASVQDREGAKWTPASLYRTLSVRYVLADGAFAGRRSRGVLGPRS
jgi:hypothetical protein